MAFRLDSWHLEVVHPEVCQRIGHGGASALAPANTLVGFEAALAVGVDMLEFDVRGGREGLVLAHTILDARRNNRVTLREALAFLAHPRFDGIGLNVDLKHLGCEAALIDSLRASGLLGRTLISCQVPTVLDRVRDVEPHARVGISIGGRVARLSQRWRDWRWHVLHGLAERRWDALMAQYRLVDSSLLEAVSARGAQLYAWTVNERTGIERLRELGVHGIATADPRLFV